MDIVRGIVTIIYVLCKLIYFIGLEIVHSILPQRKKDVAGEIVLITGAGHGIGRELALGFGRLGARVVIWDMNKGNNDATATMIRNNGGTAYTYVCDLTKTDEIHRVAERMKREVGDPYILVNNAGVLFGGELLKMEESAIRKTFEVNTLSHFWTVKEFLPAMMDQNRGHIVTIASMSAKSGTAYLVDYSSSKYAAFGFTEALREEIRVLGKTGIETTTVCPMFVNTGLCENPIDNIGRILSPEEVARAAINGTLTNKEHVYIPSSMNLHMRIAALMPRKMVLWLKAQAGTGIKPQYKFSSDKMD